MSIATLAARDAIANVLACHSRGVDRANAALLASAYHEDATVDYGFFSGPASDLVQILSTAQAAAPSTLHRTSNMWIDVDGDRAVSESYVLAYVEEPELQRLVMGRYLDQHRLVDGKWAIAHRTYVMDANTNTPSSVARPAAPAGSTGFAPQGSKGAQDPGAALLNHHQLMPSSQHMQKRSASMAEEQVDRLLSRAAIMDLVHAYARGVDRGDAALLRTLFHDDATAMCGIANGNGVEFADAIVDFVTSNLDRCFHSTSNSWVEVDGDAGVGEHYVIAHMTAGGNDIMTGGRYVDRYERRGGVWKFASRSFVMDWNSTQPTTYEGDGFYASLTTRGCFGSQDPVYAVWPR
ncbi:MAG: nuclear transport factor 2 family protein [Sphingobium sp.]|nr:nuclear transport factor 2 family protein [Sphingobium sp.]MCP5398165.1 nuclear transport factor 2 family protein [Sphingomonas sp.]